MRDEKGGKARSAAARPRRRLGLPNEAENAFLSLHSDSKAKTRRGKLSHSVTATSPSFAVTNPGSAEQPPFQLRVLQTYRRIRSGNFQFVIWNVVSVHPTPGGASGDDLIPTVFDAV